MTPPRIAVIVVNYNGGHFVLRCLDTLLGQTLAPARIIVVDNGSTDDSREAVRRRFPDVELVPAGANVGFAAANNLGAALASDCEWLALLNPDAFPEPRWLENLAAAARASPEYSSFGCRMLMDDDPSRFDGVGDVYHPSGLCWREAHGSPAAGAFETPAEIFSPCAGAALYRRDAFHDAGGFDEDFFCYMEDVDLGFRLRLRGHRSLYVPAAVVRHKGSAIAGRRSHFALYHGHRNMVWTYVKNMPAPWFWLYLPLHLAANLLSVLALGRPALRGKLDALAQLPRFWRKRRSVQGGRRACWRDVQPFFARGLLPLIRVRRFSRPPVQVPGRQRSPGNRTV